MDRPLLVYDGDCGFCRHWIARWRRITGDEIDYAPAQEVAASLPQIPADRFQQAVQLVLPDGTVYEGAEAVFRSLASRPSRRWLLYLYQRLPGFAAVSEWWYAFVARHRTGFSRLTRWLWGKQVEPPTYLLTRWLLLRSVGLVYLLAFASLWPQIGGLVGADGILPAARYLASAYEQVGGEAYWLLPSLAWLGPEVITPELLCGAGIVLSLLLLSGIAPQVMLISLWLVYLSVVSIGQDFLSFQWDSLLLETGLLAIFLAPVGWRPGIASRAPPAGFAIGLVRWLLFRLMFSSGVVKLLSQDATWWDLTALTLHYETQPIPNALSWYAHQLPVAAQQFSTAIMFIIELAVPFLIFLPRMPRLAAFASFAFLQVLIAATGNYGFFNLLSFVLGFSLLDDGQLRTLLPRRWRQREPQAVQGPQVEGLVEGGTAAAAGPASLAVPAPGPRARPLRRLVTATVGAGLVVLSLFLMTSRFFGSDKIPDTARETIRWLYPLHAVSNYGLFSVMTTSRPEIEIQGSNDGSTWLSYEFKWKAGDTKRHPPFVAPHMPRLDWQMWFAALNDFRATPWFHHFLAALFRGAPEVHDLLLTNPFPEAPPRYIRCLLHDYRFTDFTTGKDGDWWRQEVLGPYSPVIQNRQPPGETP